MFDNLARDMAKNKIIKKLKKAPKLFFIFLVNRGDSVEVLPLWGGKVGNSYYVHSKKLNIFWRLGEPPFEAIMPTPYPAYRGVVFVWVPEREIFIYLTDIKPAKEKGKLKVKAVDPETGEETELVIKEPQYLVPTFKVSEMEAKKYSQELLARRLWLEGEKEARRQEEMMQGLLNKVLPFIITVVLVIVIIIATYAAVNALNSVMRTAADAIKSIVTHVATLNSTATHAAGAGGAW